MAHQIDHVVVGADTLERGAAALADRLGATLSKSFKHAEMSTHNCLVQAGGGRYFELIAVDPDAPDPGRPRWFSLDDPATRTRLAERPRALTWVVSVASLEAVMASTPVALGEPVDFIRGERSWKLSVRKDGSLPLEGLIPGFIQWSPGPHVSGTLPDVGIRLAEVHLRHPDPDALTDVLRALGTDHLATVSKGAAGLSFKLDTPAGSVVLD